MIYGLHVDKLSLHLVGLCLAGQRDTAIGMCHVLHTASPADIESYIETMHKYKEIATKEALHA